MKLTFTSFFLIIYFSAFAQLPGDSNSIDIATITDSSLINKNYQIFIDSTGSYAPENIPDNDWKTLDNYNLKKYIPTYWITRNVYLKFTLINSSDSVETVYFIAGHYIRRNSLFIMTAPNNAQLQKDESKADGYQPILLKPGEKQTFIASFYFTKRLRNYFLPQLVKSNYLRKHKIFNYYKIDTALTAGLLLSGVLLMMIFFTAANFIVSKRKAFLYNCIYSICMFGLFFLTAFLERKTGVFTSLFLEYVDFMLLAAGTVFYIAFTRKFLDTKINYPLLNKIFVYEEKFLLLLLAAFTYIVFVTDNFFLQELLENGMKIIALVIGIVYIIIALAQRNKLMNYLAIGNAILIFFSIISFLIIVFPLKSGGIFSTSMFYYEVGIVSELICFLLGLTYKNRIELIEKTKEQESLKLEAEKQQFETRLAVLKGQQDERNRISADMHDDLGAGVTAIRLYSELAKRKIDKGSIPEIDKISFSANELLNNMNAIIWTMTSSNDTLDNMVAYIRGYALEYFENTGIKCNTHVDEDLPNIITVTGDLRRNIFLVVKEALNNILKHSKATEVDITLNGMPDGLILYIQDNGVGIDFENLRRFGNGLKNMRKRMEEMNIRFTIENNNGTLITLHYTQTL